VEILWKSMKFPFWRFFRKKPINLADLPIIERLEKLEAQFRSLPWGLRKRSGTPPNPTMGETPIDDPGPVQGKVSEADFWSQQAQAYKKGYFR
jgi:hypothetical protein